MSDKDKVLDITLRMIAQLGQEKPSNLLMAVRTHYDLWQSELIVLLKERNIPVHQYLSQLLVECGYTHATTDKVRTYMSLVAKSKKASKQQVMPVDVITTQVGISGSKARQAVAVSPAVSVPGVGSQNGSTGAVVVPVPGGVAVGSGVQSSNASVIQSVVPFSFKTALTRLKDEPMDAPWTADDDLLHEAFMNLVRETGAKSIKDLQYYFKDTEYKKIDCHTHYLAKVSSTNKVFE